MSWRLFKTSWRRLEELLARHLQDVFKTSWRHMTKTNILVLIKTPWRHLEDVSWRRMCKANILVLIKTSSVEEDERRLQDVLKTSSSRRMFAGMLFLRDAHTNYLFKPSSILKFHDKFAIENCVLIHNCFKKTTSSAF